VVAASAAHAPVAQPTASAPLRCLFPGGFSGAKSPSRRATRKLLRPWKNI
jgi:hypothetical protein